MTIPFIEENDQTRARAEHLEALRKLVGNVYPNKFERSRVTGDEDTITALVEKFKTYEPQVEEGARPAPEVLEHANEELKNVSVRISGRIATPPRVMGKAAFVHLSDGVSRLQIYVRKADVKGIHNDDGAPIEEGWELFNLLDHGDFVGVAGYLFVTKTGELSVHVTELQFLAKAMLPMPDKMHGIADPEIRQRQRYADLIAGSLKVEKDDETNKETAINTASRELSSREVFERRSKIIREMRRYLDDHGYIEVETPMLSPKATGAVARPFVTHHNALDIDLYARIAPELYLKRLVVGGFEKVYELNRNFRNEGIDRTHNPEFTMLEFYCAYMDVNGMMDFCEEMIRSTVYTATGHTHVRYNEYEIDFSRPFERLTMKEAIHRGLNQIFPSLIREFNGEDYLTDMMFINTIGTFFFLMQTGKHKETYIQLLTAIHGGKGFEQDKGLKDSINFLNKNVISETWQQAKQVEHDLLIPEWDDDSMAEAWVLLFDTVGQTFLMNPTFITDFPKPVSPLSKASPNDPFIAERFELYISGMECANGFSELNDPQEQYDRFLDQAQQRERGDDEAMVLDEDYIRALSYGMPPAAGIGIGIDRLVMLLTNKRSIRDVILFPHMRPERKTEETDKEEAASADNS
ncbi:MAG: lysyl-tRNA synthetase, class [Acidobacteriota bacterium]|jgi:lysyl-tRNA synthetase class 2|nr:lysyl-tRNA synthetase, class [Acidobacteriota bacterium]